MVKINGSNDLWSLLFVNLKLVSKYVLKYLTYIRLSLVRSCTVCEMSLLYGGSIIGRGYVNNIKYIGEKSFAVFSDFHRGSEKISLYE